MLEVTTRDASDRYLHPSMFPDRFLDESHLEGFMSTPTRELVVDLEFAPGDVIVLGVAGKLVLRSRELSSVQPLSGALSVSPVFRKQV